MHGACTSGPVLAKHSLSRCGRNACSSRLGGTAGPDPLFLLHGFTDRRFRPTVDLGSLGHDSFSS